MSKDIWHKPVETPDVDDNLIIDDWTNRTYELGYFDDNDMIFRNFRNDDIYDEEGMMRWCNVNELIHDYDRTRKALDVAKDTFNWIDETYQTGQEMEAEIWGKVQLAAQKITALEQKDVK